MSGRQRCFTVGVPTAPMTRRVPITWLLVAVKMRKQRAARTLRLHVLLLCSLFLVTHKGEDSIHSAKHTTIMYNNSPTH